MADTFHRLLRVLQLVPRHPKWTDTERIAQALDSEGFDTERRTLQRDLVRLERLGLGLQCVDDRQKPFKWSFSQNARAVLVPGLDPQAALVLRLVEMHLEHLVPKATLKAIQPHLQLARTALEHKPVARWLDKVRLIPRHQPLLPPKVDGNVTGAVHEALLDGRQLLVRYRKSRGEEPREITLHPLGLVHRDALAYLIATAWTYEDVRAYPLHRIADAKLLDAKAKEVKGFHIDAWVDKGELGFRVNAEEIDVALLFEESAARVVEETPLTTQQKMTPQKDGRVLVAARVPDTRVLHAWLLGFGGGVEVKKPAALRKVIAQAHEAALARYGSPRR